MGYDRSRELGDCCGFCLQCGWGRRFMAGGAAAVPSECPDCGGVVITDPPQVVPDVGHALTCAGCRAELRPASLFGTDIRRKPERHVRLDAMGLGDDNERTPS